MAKKTTILWLDDDLVEKTNALRLNVQTWLRWFYTGKRKANFEIMEVNNVETFAEILEKNAYKTVNDSGFIDGILIDIMLTQTQAKENLACLGQPNTKRLALDLGIQIGAAMYLKKYEADRPAWLKEYAGRSTAFFSAYSTAQSTFDQYLATEEKNCTLLKKAQLQGDEYLIPQHDFIGWCEAIYNRKNQVQQVVQS